MPKNKLSTSDLYEFWRALTPEAREEFSKKSGVSFSYINVQLIHRRRNPPISTLDALVKASDGQLTREGLIEFFNPSVESQETTNDAIITAS